MSSFLSKTRHFCGVGGVQVPWNFVWVSKRNYSGESKSSGDNSNDKQNSQVISAEPQLKSDTENKYDPNSDVLFPGSSDKMAAQGSSLNKGKGSEHRPYFNPEETEENSISEYEKDDAELSPPNNCCMSGCPNCVWIEYVEKLTKIYTNPEMSREKVLEELNKISDQNIKAFISMELRSKGLI